MAEKGINWHELSPEEVIKILNSNEKKGLSEEEVKQRLENYGRNTLPQPRKKTIFTMFLEQFNDFMIMILIVAAVVLAASGFSYLHSKKKTDFFHSLPISREMLYTVTCLDGILYLAVPYLVFLLAAVLNAV